MVGFGILLVFMECHSCTRVDFLFVEVYIAKDGRKKFRPVTHDCLYPSRNFLSHGNQENLYDWFRFEYRDEFQVYDHARDYGLYDVVLEVQFTTLDAQGIPSGIITSLYHREYFSKDGRLATAVVEDRLDDIQKTLEEDRAQSYGKRVDLITIDFTK